MTMVTPIDFPHGPRTLNETFSFQVPGSKPDRIRDQTELADAAVVTGGAGPASVRRLRREGWSKPALFDRAAYLDPVAKVDPSRWVDEQHTAGADRILTPGCWVSAVKGHATFDSQIERELGLATRFSATCLLAIDYRWLSQPKLFAEMLRCLPSSVALVLGNERDPLGVMGAVDALVRLCHKGEDLSILRCDHGAIGAIANGATHGSIGLSSTHRHVVPPGGNGRRVPNDTTPRVFVPSLMDWFRASRISEWSTTNNPLTCPCKICCGRPLERLAVEGSRDEADRHNRVVLARLTDEILSIPEPVDRRLEFSRMCARAIAGYDDMAYWNKSPAISPQLEQWAFHSQ